MKLKNIKGLLGKKKNLECSGVISNVSFEFGYNQAREEDENKEIKLDVDKIICFLNSLQEYRPERQNRFSEEGIQYLCQVSKAKLAQALAKADIIKVKEGK